MFYVERNTNSDQKITSLQIVHSQPILPNYPRVGMGETGPLAARSAQMWKTFDFFFGPSQTAGTRMPQKGRTQKTAFERKLLLIRVS